MTKERPPLDVDASQPRRSGFVTRVAGEQGTRRRVLARNATWNWAAYLINALALLLVSPFVVEMLGKSLFGVWAIINGLTGYLNIADLGIRPAIVHFIAKHDALADLKSINRYVNSAFLTLCGGALLILSGTALLAPNLAAWFDVALEHREEATTALWIAGAGMAFALPWNAFTAGLIGKQRYDITCRIDCVVLVLRTAGVLFVLALTHQGTITTPLIALALVNVGAEAIEMIWKSRLAFREVPSMRVSPRLASRGSVQGLLKYGGFNIVVALALHMTYETDAIIIGTGLSTLAVTYFDRAARLAFHARALLWAMGRVLMPELGALHARGDHAGIRHLLTAGACNMLVFAGPILVYLIVLGGAFLETWMHGDASFRWEGQSALVIMALGAAAPIASFPIVAAHQGLNRMGSLALFSLVEAVANISLSLALVGRYGIEGVALGTAIPAFVVHAVLMPWWACKSHNMSLPFYLARVWIIPLVAGVGTWFLLRTLCPTHDAYGWWALIAAAIGSVLCYLVLSFGLTRLMPWLSCPAPPPDASTSTDDPLIDPTANVEATHP